MRQSRSGGARSRGVAETAMRKQSEPLTTRLLRVLYDAESPLTRAELIRCAKVDPATEVTRPVRDLRKWHFGWMVKAFAVPNLALTLEVPCTRNAAGRPAYWLTERDRELAAVILGEAR